MFACVVTEIHICFEKDSFSYEDNSMTVKHSFYALTTVLYTHPLE